MTTLDFARRFISLNESSPVMGKFNDDFYPFLRKPMAAADNILVKRLVIYKASSTLGTVLGQIFTAKRIACDAGNQLYFCQTDDDAKTWSKTRGRDWLRSIPSVMRMLSGEKYSETALLWIFRHKWLEILGPGINSVQSRQCRFVQSDESHLDTYEPGRLTELEKRMGGRWDRQAVHITTAPDERDCNGDIREIHGFYLDGQQDEWNFRCPKCAHLITPLWGEDSREKYNGHEIFGVSGDDVIFRCPHCYFCAPDTSRERYALVKDGDYVSSNPDASIYTRSFQWPVFAGHWISWRESLLEYRMAIAAAKLGNLALLADFQKKRACRVWVNIRPDFGDGKGVNDYRLGEKMDSPDSELFMGIDRQAGKADEGEHLWVLVTQYDRLGNSRRLAFRKVQTFAQAEVVAKELTVKPEHVYCDSGYENRSTFRECGKRHWFTVRGSDDREFLHTRKIGKEMRSFSMPYSQGELQSGVIGQKVVKGMGQKGSRVPYGWAWQFVMANPTLYAHLSALIGGNAGRYFGVASDMPEDYTKNMPAFVLSEETDKKTNTVKRIYWQKVKPTDHAWDTEIMCMLGAIRAGYFPLAGAFNNTEKETAP